jgi:hypothetical protein
VRAQGENEHIRVHPNQQPISLSLSPLRHLRGPPSGPGVQGAAPPRPPEVMPPAGVFTLHHPPSTRAPRTNSKQTRSSSSSSSTSGSSSKEPTMEHASKITPTHPPLPPLCAQTAHFLLSCSLSLLLFTLYTQQIPRPTPPALRDRKPRSRLFAHNCTHPLRTRPRRKRTDCDTSARRITQRPNTHRARTRAQPHAHYGKSCKSVRCVTLR